MLHLCAMVNGENALPYIPCVVVMVGKLYLDNFETLKRYTKKEIDFTS